MTNNKKKTMSYVIKTFYFTYLLYNKVVGIHPGSVMYNIIMPSIKGTKNLAQKEVAQHP